MEDEPDEYVSNDDDDATPIDMKRTCRGTTEVASSRLDIDCLTPTARRHRAISEKIITLDDLSSILSIPMSGVVISPLEDDKDTNYELLVNCLRVIDEEATKQLHHYNYKFSWFSVESLQQEVEQLTKKISATKKEREQLASNAIHEASRLQPEKAMLESALQEVQSKAILTENELNVMRTETEAKLQGLSAELAASKQNQESTMATIEVV
ncbi:hypothetical protein GBA52_026724 [Prunus armeniaca]|nr:hypothetical protein GBA52_026724 [Prunus armeniaca]